MNKAAIEIEPMAFLEIRMQSGKEFHFIGENAKRVRSKLAEGRSEMTVMWGCPSDAEVTISRQYVECTTWFANGRP